MALLAATSARAAEVGPLLAQTAVPEEGTTERVSVSSDEAQANGPSSRPWLSDDGRFVVFGSIASNLVPGDTNGTGDIFLRDRQLGTTERISLATSGVQANGGSGGPMISADGRFVVFASAASNLVAGDANGLTDIFIRDVVLGTTELVSIVDGSGAPANGANRIPSVSADGRYVAFESLATNLTSAPDANEMFDVFVRDRLAGTTELVSVTPIGAAGNSLSDQATISANGLFVAFESFASDLPGAVDNVGTFVRGLFSDETHRVGPGVNGPAISGDGRIVAFSGGSVQPNCQGDCVTPVVYVRDREDGSLEIASVTSAGELIRGNQGSSIPALSSDGRFVTFASSTATLTSGDTNGTVDVYRHDRLSGETVRLSVSSAGASGNAPSYNESISGHAISWDGRFTTFMSQATNLVLGDTNGAIDIFVRDQPVQTAQNPVTVLFIQGIGSTSTCETSLDFVVALSWLKTALTSALEDELSSRGFLYYAYNSPYTASPTCADMLIPQYTKRDSCWSLDDVYSSGVIFVRAVPDGGQATRLASYLRSYLDAHPNEVLSIVAHSQGGVLASYVVKEKLGPSYTGRIRSIVTMDSPLLGINRAGGFPLKTYSCVGDNRLDSAHDMDSRSAVIRRVNDPSVPATKIFTIDADPGALCGFCGFPLVDDAHSTTWWASAHIRVAAPSHSDIWDGCFTQSTGRECAGPDALNLRTEGRRLVRFAACAIAALALDCVAYADETSSVHHRDDGSTQTEANDQRWSVLRAGLTRSLLRKPQRFQLERVRS